MGIPDRLLNLAKSYLDSARSRWDEVDAASQKELDETVASPAPTAWERAQAKISGARATNQSVGELGSSLDTPEPPQQLSNAPVPTVPTVQNQPSPNALAAAYRVLDVPENSDLLTVQDAYQDLCKKTDPSRFPDGSKERTLALDLQRRINSAYMMLVNALSTQSEDRFDRLEL